jgi:transcriptional regulator GlxA family with amidase domain
MQTRSRTVAVILFQEVELLDFAGIVQVLSIAGRHYNFRPFKIMPASLARGSLDTRNQCRVQVEHTLDELTHADLVLVPGGYGARRALSEPRFVSWLEARAPQAELVLGVGYGCLLLAKAGLCAGREVSLPLDVRELFAELAPTGVAGTREITASGNLLTTSSSGLAVELGLRAVEHLLGQKFANQAATQLGIRFAHAQGSKHAPIRIVEPNE